MTPIIQKIKPYYIENIGITHKGKYYIIISKQEKFGFDKKIAYWGHFIKGKSKKKQGYPCLNKITTIVQIPTGNYGFYSYDMKKIKNKNIINELNKEYEKMKPRVMVEIL